MNKQSSKAPPHKFLESSFIHTPKRKPLYRLQLGGVDKTADKIKQLTNLKSIKSIK